MGIRVTYNVALIVLDTLREDHAKDLDKLTTRGFIKYKNAIAPSTWTLPSHISMFTGLPPSQHGVYITEKTDSPLQLAKIARLSMHKLNYGILGELAKLGYNTYIVTASPFVTPYFGFKAKEVYLNILGLVKRYEDQRLDKMMKSKNLPAILLEYIKERKAARTVVDAFKFAYRSLSTFTNPKNKGGLQTVALLKKAKLDPPYFLYINIKEAHYPYTRRDIIQNIYTECYYKTAALGTCPEKCLYIRQEYPKHAQHATEIGLKLAELLDDGKTLIVITSDHGEGLCDPAFGHGYWLTEPILRVPLYVKYPTPHKPQHRGKYTPLTQLPDIIRVATGEKTTIGSDTATAETDAFCDEKQLKKHKIDKKTLHCHELRATHYS